MNPVALAQEKGDASSNGGKARRWFRPSSRLAYILSSAVTVIVFVADVILPRGATVAIGYCAVPIIAGGTRSSRFMVAMTVLCTVLTWIAGLLEPAGDSGWQAVFNRVLVTVIVWLALFVILRRARVVRELVQQRQSLKTTALELERSNGELTKFASVVAHDVRGSVSTIGLFAQLLSRSDSIQADSENRETVDSILAELAQMSAFIQDLLVYGRVGAGTIQSRDCDSGQILDDVRRRLKSDIDHNGADVSNDPLPVIQADPMLIAQLFKNLIENAIKYRGKQTPRIHISVSRQPENWLFSLRDNGIGISQQDAKQIFEPFHQASAGEAHKDGVGLGLATCKQIVERHGGRIYLQSKPGDGTTFYFTIPAATD